MDKFCYSKGPDGDYGFRSVESDYQPQAGEVLFDAKASSEQLANAFPDYTKVASNISLRAQMAELEGMVTLRMMREAFLGAADVIHKDGSPFDNMTAAQAISYVQTQIATLRSQTQA